MLLYAWGLSCVHAPGARADDHELQLRVESERQWLLGKAGEATLAVFDRSAQPVSGPAHLIPEGRWERLDAELELTGVVDRIDLVLSAEGKAALPALRVTGGGGSFTLVVADGREARGDLRPVHPLWSLLPPLLSILLALWLRQVVLALAAGILSGAWILTGDPVSAFAHALQKIVVVAVTDEFQAAILLFTASLGGMVGVMARAGGTHGLVDAAQRWIHDARSAQLGAAVLGLIIFFDDYANTLLVGNTMRPVTDRMRVSREKLSYLVDSTAAPVATIALLSTWVGYQVGLIGDGLRAIGEEATGAYGIFVASVPYAAYSWFALVLVFTLVLSRRDFGPMLAAERRARRTGELLGPRARPLLDDVGAGLDPVEGAPRRAHVALLPVITVLVATVVSLYVDGRRTLVSEVGVAGIEQHGLRDVFASADPAAALLWAVVLGSSVAVLLAVGERITDLQTAMDSWTSGAKAMVPALVILVLAWSIGDVCERLGTAQVVVDAATGNLSARLVPTVSFAVAAFLGFSTGTSWGTMAILMPIVVPLSTQLPQAAGLGEVASGAIFLSSISSVLSGSVFGDHCSPISDTTIMSSMASAADHVDHVRTQLPYALVAGLVAVLLGTLPAGYGVAPWLTLPAGALILVVAVRLIGRRPGEAETETR